MLNYVIFVLDETGSMFDIKDDTIGGFNQFVKELKDTTTPDAPTRFTLLKFNSANRSLIYDLVELDDVKPLTDQSYSPGGATPLIDACMEAVLRTADRAAKEDGEVRVQLVIQTDGKENCSVEHTNAELKKLIADRTKSGWLFTFLGAGEEAFAQASGMGINPGHALNYSRGQSASAFESASRVSAEYRVSGQSVKGFTAEERNASREK